jgi:hypothetical protein
LRSDLVPINTIGMASSTAEMNLERLHPSGGRADLVGPPSRGWQKGKMRPPWKLLVEGFGKIERAEVEVRPLMLFVGENNTGKSYLASLLWGLLAIPNTLFDEAVEKLPSWQACADWFRERSAEAKGPKHSYSFSRTDRALFAKLFNDALELGKDGFAQRLFGSKTMTVGRIRVEPNLDYAYPRLSIVPTKPDAENKEPWGYFEVESRDTILGLEVPRKLGTLAERSLLPFTTVSTALSGLSSTTESRDRIFNARMPAFLPASRTGFMLLYKAVARRSLHEAFRPVSTPEKWLDLTAPAFDFIDLIAFGLQGDKGHYGEEADLLEQDVGGRVELVTAQGAVNEYRYRPDGGSPPLSMALSSSLITELAPIILILRHAADFPVLILEEPEAHLHPKLQRRLAQVIVRLIRKGLYVWITTHSENFCQQINNFLKIGGHPDRAALQKELGYGDQDYLEVDDVAGYQFTPEGDKSVVSELKKTPRGLVMPTFNRELTDLSKETLFLQRKTTEEG